MAWICSRLPRVVRLHPDKGRCFVGAIKRRNLMAKQNSESKRLLSYVIAEWACSLKYQNLSPEAIQAAKLFWFDSIGCALGGSQQEDAKILLKHYQAMNSRDAALRRPVGAARRPYQSGENGKATAFVSGFKTNPVDAAFMNG